jgi:hypothetical protein
MKKILFSLLLLRGFCLNGNAQSPSFGKDEAIHIFIGSSIVYAGTLSLGLNQSMARDERSRDFLKKGSLMFMAVGGAIVLDKLLSFTNKPKNINLSTTQNGVGLIVKF